MKRRSNWIVTPDKFLRLAEVQRLFAMLEDAKDIALQRGCFYAHIRDCFILKTFFQSGVRVHELCLLKVGNLVGNSLVVERGKGGKRRSIILSKGAVKTIREFIKLKKTVLDEPTDPTSPLFLSERRKPYSVRGVRARVKFWFKRAGVADNLSCHSARHSYVSHLLASGVDLPTVRDNAGHSSLAVTSLYGHAVKGELDVEPYESRAKNKKT